MRRDRPALFKGRHFEPEIIILCVRRYLRYALSLRNLAEIMAERNVPVDHVTIWRWIQRYAPELSRRCRPELRRTNGSWRVDETYVRVAGKWTYLYRRWIRRVTRSISCSLRSAMQVLPNASFKEPCARQTILGHELSTWTAILPIRRQSTNSNARENSAGAAVVDPFAI
jgi:DDE domain